MSEITTSAPAAPPGLTGATETLGIAKVISLYLPRWPSDRLRWKGKDFPKRDESLVTAIMEGQRRVVASIDEAAERLGLACGMTITHAQSLVPDLHVVNATLDDDADGLVRLALWCTMYSPLVTPDPPDGVFIDVAGSAHLFQGEASLLEDLCKRLKAAGIASKAAVADTPGCAWALARYGDTTIVSPGRTSEAIASLPIASLRLSKEGRPATCHCLKIAGRLELIKLLPVCESGRSF